MKKENMKKEKIIVTAALPYANGQLHIGHLLEHIQGDIFTRFLRLVGNDALYICAADMHGTPVEVNAQKAGQTTHTFALKHWKEQKKDFKNFLIHYDNYHKTHSPENKELAEWFFSELKQKGHIYTKKMNVIFCPHCPRYLPDRFVRGTCPNCTAMDQYGDVCESCGSVLKASELINPKCSLCGKTPEQRESEHYFFALKKCKAQLKKWLSSAYIQPEVRNSLKEWMTKGLEDWCISRDEPYFGFEIPGSKKELGVKKFFYVWLDAPIGYISSTKHLLDKKGRNWKDFWLKGQVYHFIGKDIVYFHFLFWPAMLMLMGIPVPKLTVHGFITVNGQKMSKSRGTFFTIKDFLNLYPPEALRFYYAANLDRKVVDIDINLEDFKAVTNNVLMGNLGNYCYRVLTFAHKHYGKITKVKEEQALEKKILALTRKVEESYQAQDFKLAVKQILQISDIGNSYFQKSEPWKDKQEKQAAVGFCVNLARNLSIIVSPILPLFAAKVQKSLGTKNLGWQDISFSWKGKVAEPKKLVEKIEHIPKSQQFPLKMMVGKIVQVQNHPDADSLYLMQVDLGKKKGKKQVIAGLKKYLPVSALLNKKAIFCVNIKPAKIRGKLSEVMILAADDGESVAILETPKTPLGKEAHFLGMESGSEQLTFQEFLELRMTVAQGGVNYDGKKLVTSSEEISLETIKNGGRVR